MKEAINQFIQEKGKELVFITGSAVVVLALAFGHALFTEGGDPYLPEGLLSARSRVNRAISDSLLITNEATDNLNELLKLETEGKTGEVLQKIGEYEAPLAEINPAVAKAAVDIEKIARLMPEVKPRGARAVLSDAMTRAAMIGQALLSFSQQMAVLYDGLEARVHGEEFSGDYASLVGGANAQVREINALYDQYEADMDRFKLLTDD